MCLLSWCAIDKYDAILIARFAAWSEWKSAVVESVLVRLRSERLS